MSIHLLSGLVSEGVVNRDLYVVGASFMDTSGGGRASSCQISHQIGQVYHSHLP